LFKIDLLNEEDGACAFIMYVADIMRWDAANFSGDVEIGWSVQTYSKF